MYYATRDYKDFNIYEKAPSVSYNHGEFKHRGFGYTWHNISCVNIYCYGSTLYTLSNSFL